MAATLLLDQAVKLAISGWLGPGTAAQRWELVGRYLALHYVENRGAAFGLFAGQPWLLAIAAVLAALLFIVGLANLAGSSRAVATGLGLVVGGALGNVIDRVRLGFVVDYIAVGVWPKFNVADCAITLGLALLGWYAFAPHGRSPRT